MEPLLNWLGHYWWIVFPVMGVAGGVAKRWEWAARRRHERRLETLRMKAEIKKAELEARGLPTRQGPAVIDTTASVAPSELLTRLFAEHDQITARWLDYELDVAKLIAFPAMSDGRQPPGRGLSEGEEDRGCSAPGIRRRQGLGEAGRGVPRCGRRLRGRIRDRREGRPAPARLDLHRIGAQAPRPRAAAPQGRRRRVGDAGRAQRRLQAGARRARRSDPAQRRGRRSAREAGGPGTAFRFRTAGFRGGRRRPYLVPRAPRREPGLTTL